MTSVRPIRILLHYPGTQEGWRRLSATLGHLIQDGAATLDSPTSLVAFRLKPDVDIDEARRAVRLFEEVIDKQGSVELDLGSAGPPESEQ